MEVRDVEDATYLMHLERARALFEDMYTLLQGEGRIIVTLFAGAVMDDMEEVTEGGSVKIITAMKNGAGMRGPFHIVDGAAYFTLELTPTAVKEWGYAEDSHTLWFNLSFSGAPVEVHFSPLVVNRMALTGPEGVTHSTPISPYTPSDFFLIEEGDEAQLIESRCPYTEWQMRQQPALSEPATVADNVVPLVRKKQYH